AAALLLALLLGARMITRAKEPAAQAIVGPTTGLTITQLAPPEPPTASATELPATIELPTESIAPTPIPAPSSYATYMTVADDTLAAIAERMGSDADAIAALNRLDPAVPLRAEHPLVIPVYRAGAAGAGGLVIRRGNPAEPKVALTFDIEIDDKTLYGILD